MYFAYSQYFFYVATISLTVMFPVMPDKNSKNYHSLVYIQSQVVRVFILQSYRRTSPICYWRTCITTGHS